MMTLPVAALRYLVVIAVCACLVVCAGCAISPTSLPLPAQGVDASMPLDIEFSDVLNLPAKAKVTLDGTRIGTVQNVTLTPEHVRVRITVEDDLNLPEETTARITQSTLLGDTYIQLERPSSRQSGEVLTSGDRIPRARAMSAPPVADTLATIALFLGQGSIQQINTMTRELATVLPTTTEESGELARVLADDLRDLSDQSQTLDRILDGANATATTLDSRREAIEAAFSPRMMKGWKNLTSLFGNVGVLLPSVGSVYSGGYWLIPTLKAVTRATNTIDVSGAGAMDMDPVAVIRDKLLPLIASPRVSVDSFVTTTGQDASPEIAAILRMLGLMR